MNFPEIRSMAVTFARLLEDGAEDSVRRTLLDVVPTIVRRRFRPDNGISFLVHYTSVDTLFSMLTYLTDHNDQSPIAANNERPHDDPGFLRMYDTFHSNDPNEGRFFISSATSGHGFRKRHQNLWDLMINRSRLPAYVASFRGISERSEVDDLVYWRTYGREGAGCAIVFPVSFIPSDAPLYQVQYGPRKVASELDHLCRVFDDLASLQVLRDRGLLNTSVEIPPYIASALSPIIYLHKATDYEFEEEVRLVITSVDVDSHSLFFHRARDSEMGTRIRHFAHVDALSVRNLLRTGSSIVLGPAVRSRANVRYVIGRRLTELGLPGPKLIESRIAYRP